MTIVSSSSRVAVVDIGSNSVRLVIYEVMRASALPSFNEKVMAGLGRELNQTGRLSPKGIELALSQLRRFRAILSALGVTNICAVATAAVREAEDGPEFTQAAEEALGFGVRVLSGLDEARLSALGASSGFFAPRGLVGDLGGSSLELKHVGYGKDVPGESHLLGPLALARDGFDEKRVRKAVRKALKNSAQVTSKASTFYAVGGAWRTFASLHMEVSNYSLQVLQDYRMSATQVAQTARLAIQSATDVSARNTVRAVAGRRTRHMPYAAIALEEILGLGGFGSITVSSYGLREGVLREHIGPQASDPLLDGAIAFVRLDEQQIAFADALYDFVMPALSSEKDLFGSLVANERVLRAACLLADSAGRFHPDHRAIMAYDQALRAPYAAVSHTERAMIAHAIGVRYSRHFKRPKPYLTINSDAESDRARQLGAAMRLGAVFSGRSGPILKRAKLKRTSDYLILKVKKDSAAMVSDTVMRRLAQTASLLGLQEDVVIG